MALLSVHTVGFGKCHSWRDYFCGFTSGDRDYYYGCSDHKRLHNKIVSALKVGSLK